MHERPLTYPLTSVSTTPRKIGQNTEQGDKFIFDISIVTDYNPAILLSVNRPTPGRNDDIECIALEKQGR